MAEKYKWLFFDVGFTLVDETECYAQFIHNCISSLQQQGTDISFEEYSNEMIQASKERKKPIRTVWEKYSALEQPFWNSDYEVIYSDAAFVLKELKKTYNLGIIANQGAGLAQRLAKHGIDSFFDIVVSSHDVGITKPDPDIFTHALKLADTAAAACVYVGDRCDNDIIPAKKLGFYTVRVMQGLGRYQPEDSVYKSDITVSALSELLNHL